MNRIRIIATTLTVLLFFTGCDKYHRNNYVGDWEFVTKKLVYKRVDNGIEILKCDTIYYSGKISSGSNDKELVFQYTEGDKVSAYLDIEGFLYVTPCGAIGSNGYFEGNSKVYFDIGWEYPDAGEGHYIIGTKK